MGGEWRVGIAGLSRSSAWRRLEEWLSLDAARVVAVADPDRRRRERARRLGLSRVYSEPRELLARETLDILHVAGDPLNQGALVASALMRGLDVVVEPPLAVGAAGVRRSLAGARTYRGLLLPAWPAAFDPLWRRLVEHRPVAGEPVHLEARLLLGYEPWWDDLEEEAAADPDLPLPGAMALGADRLVHLALELLGIPEEVAAQVEQDQLFGRAWERRASVALLYPWGTARLVLGVDLDQEDPGTGGGAGADLVLEGKGGRLQMRGRLLTVERFGQGSAVSLPTADPGLGDHPPGQMVRLLERGQEPPGSLSPHRAATVYRVLAALERSAAGQGRREPVQGHAPGGLSGPPSVPAAAAPAPAHPNGEA